MVSTSAEMDAVGGYMNSKGMSIIKGAWIDGTDAVTDGVWLSESGEEITYIKFMGLEPNGWGSENCLGISSTAASDNSCDGNGFIYYTLCEQ